uniref:FACT complex subunit n=1 Tax=Paramoeba aestuarina TaxID=180227 RepID=A0A7S4NMW4_9EUKA
MKKEGGKLAEAWNNFFVAYVKKEGLQSASITDGLGGVFSVKEESDIQIIRKSAAITTSTYKKFLLNEIEIAIDEEKRVSHSKLAEKVEDIIMNTPEQITKALMDADIDSCYTPIIQSGAPYNLKPSAQSDDKNLQFGTIIASMGVRYKRFCSNVCRTFFVNPSAEQKKHYEIALELHQMALDKLKPGAILGDVVKEVEEGAKQRGVGQFFSANLGFGIGIEFIERFLSIVPASTKEVKEGMVFNIDIGLAGMETENDKKKKEGYAIKISDTVKIEEKGAVLLTTNPRDYKDIAYTLEDEEEIQEREKQKREKKVKQEQKMKEMARGKEKDIYVEEERGGWGEERAYRTRGAGRKKGEDDEAKKSAEAKREAHQKLLWEKMREAALAKLSSTKKKDRNEKEKEIKIENLISYNRPQDLPADLPHNRIYVDFPSDSVLIPIYGDLIPFHISNIKNATSLQTEEFELRISFVAPSVGPGGGVTNQIPSVANNPDCVFLREVTFKMGTEKNLSLVLRHIQELRKRWNQKQQMKKKTEGIVEQDKLVLHRGGDFPRLHNVLVRPALGGRRTAGTLEVHKNGFLFKGGKGQTLELLFNNIKHAFYQPCKKGSLITVIHFHLINAILIGKKRTSDVQFFVEVMEAVRDVEKDKRSMFDQDEMEEEQREKQNKKKWNDKFRKFVQQTSNVVDGLSFDSPFEQLSFHGIVDRHNVRLCPSVDALLFIQEPPFFCLTLDEVEVAVFERVHFHLKHFDLTFVFKDRTKKTCRLGSIPMESFDTIEEWLDSCDIKYYTYKGNLNWDQVIASIVDSPESFWVEVGGWEGMFVGDDDEEEDESGDDSGFEAESGSESDSYSDYSESGSDFNEGDESESDEEEESEGEDWEEMEKKAREEDMKKFRGDEMKRKREDEDEDERDFRPKKKKR